MDGFLNYSFDGPYGWHIKLAATAEARAVKATLADEIRADLYGQDIYDLSVRQVKISGSPVRDWRVSFWHQNAGAEPPVGDDWRDTPGLTQVRGRLWWTDREAERQAENDRLRIDT